MSDNNAQPLPDLRQLSLSDRSSDSSGLSRLTFPLNTCKRLAGPLRVFSLFPELPFEVQSIIWHITLQPRIVEIRFKQELGFCGKAPYPVALAVNRASRESVKYAYPLCFGNILYPANVPFNFALDTLYIEEDFQPHVMSFLFSLSSFELDNLRRFAFTAYIDEDYMKNRNPKIDAERAIGSVVPLMKSLDFFQTVCWIKSHFKSDDYDRSEGPIQFYNEFPTCFGHQCAERKEWKIGHLKTCDEQDADGCDCVYPPDSCSCYVKPKDWKDFGLSKIPRLKMEAVWGWRPHSLPRPRF